jgi:hypothetical protein
MAAVYLALAYSTFGFARGAGKSTGEQNSGMSARLMQTGVGTIALIAAGVIIVAASRSEPKKATGLDGASKHSGPNPTEQRS